MKSPSVILKREEVVVGRVEVGAMHHQALRVRRLEALAARLDLQEEPNLGVAVAAAAVAAQVALVEPLGEWLRNIRWKKL